MFVGENVGWYHCQKVRLGYPGKKLTTLHTWSIKIKSIILKLASMQMTQILKII